MNEETFVDAIRGVADLMIVSGFLWSGGRITHGLANMKRLAKETWQKAITETLIGVVALLGFGAVILLF